MTDLVSDIPGVGQGRRFATHARKNVRARSLALHATTLVAPLAIARGVEALTGSRRAGVIAGGLTLAKLVALRWQLARWFTAEPAYYVERRVGDLEIRRYAPRIEAHTRLTVPDFETAIDVGFRRLASFIRRGNSEHRAISMTSPVLVKPRATTHTIAFVMPPGYARASLPEPSDDRIRLVDVPAHRIAVMRFRGRYTDEVVVEQTRRLHDLVEAAGLETRGQPIFAGFDPPWTLPWLRRTEMWIELV